MESNAIADLTREVEGHKATLTSLFTEVEKIIVGQKYLIERLLMGVLSGGHILVEGVPGLAKTSAVRAVAQALNVSFQRIQFTPDLLPADIIGTQVYNPKTHEFYVKKGPLFHNIILADEINRAPAKVQSALLEAMQEKQITIGEETFKLAEPFTVLATQNPIEQEGTYPLPEAQMDRFMMKLTVSYPSRQEEVAIMDRIVAETSGVIAPVLKPENILSIRQTIRRIHVDPKVSDYVVRLVIATREPPLPELVRHIQFGASPRGSISLLTASKAYAFLQGRAYVTPQDVKIMAPDVLRHRLILSFEAEAENLTTDDLLKKILERVDVP